MTVKPGTAVTLMSLLFGGRTDAWGHDKGGTKYIDGAKPDPITKQWNPDERVPVTRQTWHDHLFGKSPMGTYPCDHVDGLLQSRWACIDIDFNDYKLAVRMRKELDGVGISAYVESSRSKGWHVWVFFEDWVETKYSRALLLWLVDDLGHPKMEVNPKQFSLREGEIGNYVRTPYPARTHNTGRQLVVDQSGRRLSLTEFLDRVETTDRGLVERLGRSSPHFPRRIQPVASLGNTSRSWDGATGEWTKQEASLYLNDPTAMIPQGQRDNTLHTIAKLMAGLGWDPDLMRSTMTRIVESQVEGHFSLRVALDKVDRAFSEQQRKNGYG